MTIDRTNRALYFVIFFTKHVLLTDHLTIDSDLFQVPLIFCLHFQHRETPSSRIVYINLLPITMANQRMIVTISISSFLPPFVVGKFPGKFSVGIDAGAVITISSHPATHTCDNSFLFLQTHYLNQNNKTTSPWQWPWESWRNNFFFLVKRDAMFLMTILSFLQSIKVSQFDSSIT